MQTLTSDCFFSKQHEQVAVKVYLSNNESKMESCSPTELLRIARQDNQLSTAYKEIRKEVCYQMNILLLKLGVVTIFARICNIIS